MRCSLISVWFSGSRQATHVYMCPMCPIPHWLHMFPSFVEAEHLPNNGCDIFQITVMSSLSFTMSLGGLDLTRIVRKVGNVRNGRSNSPCWAPPTCCCCVCRTIFALCVKINRLLSVLATMVWGTAGSAPGMLPFIPA